jgi:hypothetical protein
MINLFSHEMFEPADVFGASSGVLSLISHKNSIDCLNHFRKLKHFKIFVIRLIFTNKMNMISKKKITACGICKSFRDELNKDGSSCLKFFAFPITSKQSLLLSL